MNKQDFYLVVDSRDHILLVGETNPVLPILWNRDGEYNIIQKKIIQNVIDINADYAKLHSDKGISPIVAIWWCDGIPISNQAGRALEGE